MTVPAFVTAQMVREYIGLESDATSRYSDATIGSNMRAAGDWLEQRTHRFLWDRTATVTLTTNGQASTQIPGLRVPSSVLLAGTTLDVDETYWLIPDARQTGLYTGLQVRPHGGRAGFLRSSEWFDRGLDLPGRPGGDFAYSSLPNDLVVAGAWGFVAGSEPEEALHAYKVLAAYFTKRPDAILSGGFMTEDGNSFDLSQYPVEVSTFVAGWMLRPMAVAV